MSISKNKWQSAKKTPGNEIAWRIEDVFQIFDKARASNTMILGGDVLTDDISYTYDNWYYIPVPNASKQENVLWSYSCALEYISDYIERNGKDFYVVVVLEKYNDHFLH